MKNTVYIYNITSELDDEIEVSQIENLFGCPVCMEDIGQPSYEPFDPELMESNGKPPIEPEELEAMQVRLLISDEVAYRESRHSFDEERRWNRNHAAYSGGYNPYQ